MGYLIVAAYLGFGIYFNYTPGDWVVGAVIWGIVYFSGATDNLSDSHKKADNKAIESEPEVSPIPPKQVKEKPHKIDSIESANKFEEHYFDKTLKTLPKLSSDELREVGDFFFKIRSGEFDEVESNNVTIFKTFKEAQDFIKKSPVGKSIVRLDNDLGFEVKVVNKELDKQQSSATISKPKSSVASNYFKIESYPTVRVVNAQWLGSVQDIQNIRKENIKNNREINSGMPISLEEVDLFISWTESGKSLLEIQNFFQRKIASLEKFVSKDGGKRERLADRCRVTSWNESQKPKLSSKSAVTIDKKSKSLDKKYSAITPSNNHVVNAPEKDRELDDLIQNPCLDCDCEIPQARLDSIPNAVRCASCQSDYERDNPDSVARKIEDKSIMTREGAKQMRAKQYGTNIRNKI
jgi:RNA polymerase-binding transcription factor DksA